jgi:hypothetical protein
MSGLIDRGSQAFAQGDYPQAASAFLKLQSLYSNEPAWHASRLSEKIMPLTGYASLKAGLYEQAVDSLETFLQQDNPAYSQETFAKYSIALALKRNGDFPAALDAFSAFRESSHSTSQQSIARIHEADIHFKSDQPEAALKILSLVIESDAAIRIRTQARLLATREYLNQKNFSDVSRLLLESSWSSDTMPELAMLAFLSIEAGDAFLANNLPKDALKAYQLVPNKDTLIKQQTDKLDQLKGIFESRRKSVGMGGIMWTDFYEQLLSSATAQLEALQQADDYSDALLLRRGRASLLSNRPYEAWLLFERVARFSEDDIAEQGQFHWILAAKELGRYANAIGILGSLPERRFGRRCFVLDRPHAYGCPAVRRRYSSAKRIGQRSRRARIANRLHFSTRPMLFAYRQEFSGSKRFRASRNIRPQPGPGRKIKIMGRHQSLSRTFLRRSADRFQSA